MGRIKQLLEDEYEQAFPYEQEYDMWMASMERDFQEEVEYRAKLVVTDNTNIILDKDEYSPFVTVNS